MKRCFKRGVLASVAILLMILAAFSASANGGGSGSAPATPAIRAPASFSAKDIKIERINVVDEDKVVSVRIKNNDARMRVKISAVIPELGVIATRGPFLVGSGERTSRVLVLEDVPDYASGEYTVRIVAKDRTKRVKHRPIII